MRATDDDARHDVRESSGTLCSAFGVTRRFDDDAADQFVLPLCRDDGRSKQRPPIGYRVIAPLRSANRHAGACGRRPEEFPFERQRPHAVSSTTPSSAAIRRVAAPHRPDRKTVWIAASSSRPREPSASPDDLSYPATPSQDGPPSLQRKEGNVYEPRPDQAMDPARASSDRLPHWPCENAERGLCDRARSSRDRLRSRFQWTAPEPPSPIGHHCADDSPYHEREETE